VASNVFVTRAFQMFLETVRREHLSHTPMAQGIIFSCYLLQIHIVLPQAVPVKDSRNS